MADGIATNHKDTASVGTDAGKPVEGGLARWKHVVLYCIRIEDKYTYRELIDRVSHMNDVRAALLNKGKT